MRPLVVAVLSLSSAIPASAAPPVIEVGTVCRLEGPVAVRQKRGGKKTRVPAGTTVEVTVVQKRWATVRAGELQGTVGLGRLRRLCEPVLPQDRPEPANAQTAGKLPEATADTEPAGETPLGDPAMDSAEPDKTPAAPPANEEPSLDTEPKTSESAIASADTPRGSETRIRIAVMDLRASEGIASDLMASLTGLIPQEIEALGPFKAISSQEIHRMLELEVIRQSLGCDDAGCLAEIGGALGTDYLVSGSVTAVGPQRFLIQVQLMSIAESRIDARVTRQHEGNVAGLVDEVRFAARLLVRDLLAERAGRLLVAVQGEGATIRVDGTIVGVSPMGPVEVAGGAHTVTVEKEGFVRERRDVQIAAQQETRLDVALRPSDDFLKDYQATAARTRMIAWTGIAVGAAGLASSGVFFMLGQGTADELEPKVEAYNEASARSSAELNEIDDLNARLGLYDTLTVVSAGVGLVAAGTGLVLLLTGDDPSRYEATTGAGVAAGGWSVTAGAGSLRLTAQF